MDRTESEATQRGLDLTEPGMPTLELRKDYGKEYWGSLVARGTVLKPTFIHSGLGSHVLLAACGARESAYEDTVPTGDGTIRSQGRFTAALFRQLEIYGIGLRYTDVVDMIGKIPGCVTLMFQYNATRPIGLRQTPQCDGHNKGDFLFRAQITPNKRPLYPIVRVSGDGCSVRVGEIHNVSLGAKFAVYASKMSANNDERLGYICVPADGKIGVLETPMRVCLSCDTPFFIPPKGAFAAQILPGDTKDRKRLRVYVDPSIQDVVVSALAREITDSTREPWRFTVSPQETALLVIAPDGDRVQFLHRDPRILSLGMQRLYHSAPRSPHIIQRVLCSAGQFFAHLTSEPTNVSFKKHVKVRVQEFRDTGHLADDLEAVMEKGAYYLVDEDKPVIVTANESMQYGISLSNYIKRGLFVWMCYFDASTLEIRKTCRLKLLAPLLIVLSQRTITTQAM
jgi:hypothetical protein